jgi:hypothetical protein
MVALPHTISDSMLPLIFFGIELINRASRRGLWLCPIAGGD